MSNVTITTPVIRPINITIPTGKPGLDGADGATGEPGAGVAIKGNLSGTDTALPTDPEIGDLWIIGEPVPIAAPVSVPGDGIVWDGATWSNVGPIQGPQGDAGIVTSDVPPSDTTVLWADTSDETVLTADTVLVYTYTDETALRPTATVVFWVPDPYTLDDPFGAIPGDLVLRTTPGVVQGINGLAKMWKGTPEEFEVLPTHDDDTVYYVINP